MEDDKALRLAKTVKQLKEQVSELSSKAETIIKLQGPKGDKGDTGKQGLPGIQGARGRDGVDGKDGRDGVDGVGIASVEVTFDNSLLVRLTDGTELDAGEIQVQPTANGQAFVTQYKQSSGSDPIRTVIGDHVVSPEDVTILADATTGDITITLPVAVNYFARKLTIKKIDESINVVSVAAVGTNLIDGDTVMILTRPYVSITVYSNGLNWYII